MNKTEYKKCTLVGSSTSSEGIITLLTDYFYNKNPVILEPTEDDTEFIVKSTTGKDIKDFKYITVYEGVNINDEMITSTTVYDKYMQTYTYEVGVKSPSTFKRLSFETGDLEYADFR